MSNLVKRTMTSIESRITVTHTADGSPIEYFMNVSDVLGTKFGHVMLEIDWIESGPTESWDDNDVIIQNHIKSGNLVKVVGDLENKVWRQI